MLCNPDDPTLCTIIIMILIILFPLMIYYIYVYKYKTSNSMSITNSESEVNLPKIEHYSNELFDSIKQGKGNYSWNQLRVGKRAVDCYRQEGKKCLDYENCGLCIKDGNATCMPGDEQGPLFKEGCQGWWYSNYYDNSIFGEKVTTITPPYSMFYSDYESRMPSSRSIFTLQ
jgi:hypothetical protein